MATPFAPIATSILAIVFLTAVASVGSVAIFAVGHRYSAWLWMLLLLVVGVTGIALNLLSSMVVLTTEISTIFLLSRVHPTSAQPKGLAFRISLIDIVALVTSCAAVFAVWNQRVPQPNVQLALLLGVTIGANGSLVFMGPRFDLSWWVRGLALFVICLISSVLKYVLPEAEIVEWLPQSVANVWFYHPTVQWFSFCVISSLLLQLLGCYRPERKVMRTDESFDAEIVVEWPKVRGAAWRLGITGLLASVWIGALVHVMVGRGPMGPNVQLGSNRKLRDIAYEVHERFRYDQFDHEKMVPYIIDVNDPVAAKALREARPHIRSLEPMFYGGQVRSTFLLTLSILFASAGESHYQKSEFAEATEYHLDLFRLGTIMSKGGYPDELYCRWIGNSMQRWAIAQVGHSAPNLDAAKRQEVIDELARLRAMNPPPRTTYWWHREGFVGSVKRPAVVTKLASDLLWLTQELGSHMEIPVQIHIDRFEARYASAIADVKAGKRKTP